MAGIGGHDQLMVHGRIRASGVWRADAFFECCAVGEHRIMQSVMKKGCKKGMQLHPFFDSGRRPGVPGCNKAC
ncbi:hypothetical protein [Comamonas testosteroni]|uniref:hypothetical protein n=1 Tax=Comamonas testosteroni TaxID=285 RepID=UPI000B1E18E8|nr:hypothetical protein [Comamonas testosteroni]MDN5540400.1 hypothetical protein [Comamonas sp.]